MTDVTVQWLPWRRRRQVLRDEQAAERSAAEKLVADGMSAFHEQLLQVGWLTRQLREVTAELRNLAEQERIAREGGSRARPDGTQ